MEADFPPLEDVHESEFIAFSDSLIGIYVYDDENLEVRILCLRKFQLVKTLKIDGNTKEIKAVAQNSEYVVAITTSKCFLFSVREIVETGAEAITKFPINEPSDEEEYMSSCIVGQLLVVCRSCPNVQFFCCDLNKVLANVGECKTITSSIWREMLNEKVDWVGRSFMVQEKC